MMRSVRMGLWSMVRIVRGSFLPEERHDFEEDAVCYCPAPERKQDEVDERAERHTPIIQNKPRKSGACS
jgi:hypothetical protein